MSEEGTKSDLPPLNAEEIRLNLGRLCRTQLEIIGLIKEVREQSWRFGRPGFDDRIGNLKNRLEALDKVLLPPLR